MSARPRVAVIGAGYAGMAAAQTLADRGATPLVFEAAPQLGGRARRIEYQGEVLDNGQHILSGAYTSLIGLMAQAGVPDGAMTRLPLRLSMPPTFRLEAPRWPAPLHLAFGLLGARGLSWADRFAAIRLMRFLQRRDYQLDEDITIAALLQHTAQTDAVTRFLWAPLAVAALNTPVETASARVFAAVLRDALGATRSASDLLLPRVDLSALYPEAAAHRIAASGGEIRAGIRVRALQSRERGVGVVTDNATEPVDAAIIAIGPHQFDSIALPDGVRPAELPVEAIVTVYLKFARRVRLPEPMMGQPGGTVHWFFDRRALLTPDANDGLVAAVISAAPAPAREHAPLETVMCELVALTGPLPEPEWSKTVTEKFATFACTPAVQAMRPAMRTSEPRLFLAGDYVAGDYPATLESAARSGMAAAEAAMQIS